MPLDNASQEMCLQAGKITGYDKEGLARHGSETTGLGYEGMKRWCRKEKWF